MTKAGEQGYFIEYHQNGSAMKVSAIDPVTGVEASIVASTTTAQSELNRLAVQKLEYVLRKQGFLPADEGKEKPPRPGIVV